MIGGLLVLLVCQLVGEVVVRLTGLPLPGPVVGMLVFLAVLRVRRPGERSDLVVGANALLGHLQLLFVLQALVVVQGVVALLRSADWGGSKGELFGYLAVCFLLVPGGLVLSVEERNRWGSLVLAAACLTVAVVVVRLLTVWDAGV